MSDPNTPEFLVAKLREIVAPPYCQIAADLIERLIRERNEARESCDDWHKRACEDVARADAAETEVARLREALRDILQQPYTTLGIRDRAREALTCEGDPNA
jgi:uncharacterized coiled-coil DUF342 family protein